ncbi:Zinc finger, PHD-type,Zinc finger, RING-type,Zinc finger, FYVE/PHD-type,Zinc finger, PHD-type, partial [Cinara cedri]
MEYPKERGYWFDVTVKWVKSLRRCNEVIGDIIHGLGKTVLKNCHLTFVDDIYTIKPNTLLVNRTPNEDKLMQTEPVMRAGPLHCIACKDNLEKYCKECGCQICGGKDNEDRQIMCDECDHPYHMSCLDPPMELIPEDDDWYCPSCKTEENDIVGAGQELKHKKHKKTTSNRDWGKGYACVGREKTCDIVPVDHFGAIPGIEVGTTWLLRSQVSASGVHRPPTGRIHGRDKVGAFSIVFSGGYEDDVDNGDVIMYTGSGGRNLKDKNKKPVKQSIKLELTRSNRALALNCDSELNVNGANAVNWKDGKPLRVIRCSNSKHSKYAPKLGYRYDGLYKVYSYFPVRGLSGYIVWRYVLKRDDPAPAPWTQESTDNMAKKGREIIIPENYNIKTTIKQEKRPFKENEESNESTSGSSKTEGITDDMKKKNKLMYTLKPELEDFIRYDTENEKRWAECMGFLDKGKK